MIPPSVFPIKSVISLAPSANIYWSVSNAKLVIKIGITFFIKLHSSFSIHTYIPNGTNIATFNIISDISTLLLIISDPAKGTKFILLRFMVSMDEISNCNLNSIIHVKIIM